MCGCDPSKKYPSRTGAEQAEVTGPSEIEELRPREEDMSLANVIEVLCLIAIVILAGRFFKMRSRY